MSETDATPPRKPAKVGPIDELNRAIRKITSIPAETGSDEWRAKAEACRKYFKLTRGDSNDLVEHLVWSFLTDSCGVTEPA